MKNGVDCETSEFSPKCEKGDRMSGVLEKVESFREDCLATYYYDEENNEVEILYKHKSGRLEATVLIETLAGAIIDISQIQSSDKTGEET